MTRRRLLVLAGVLVLVGYLLTGLTQVRPGERAVVRRFGRVLAEQPEAGLWIGLPWGLERVDRVAVDQVRRVEVGYRPETEENGLTTPEGQLLTGDHNLVDLQVVLHYTILRDEVEAYVVQAEQVDGLVERAAETALAEWVAGRPIDEVLLTGKVALPRWLVARTREFLEPYRLGVEVRDATVAHLLPPVEVKEAFDDVTQAQTTMRTQWYNAEQDAEQKRRTAAAECYRRRQLAEAYTEEQLKLARAEAASFRKRLAQYETMKRTNPDALGAIWWEEMGKLFAKLQQDGHIDLLDSHLGPDGLDITVVTPQKK